MSKMELLEIKNLSKKYDDKYVLKDINLNISSGKIIGLLGKNGAGKTTLIKLLKYDLKYMIKNMCVFYILSIFFAITTRLLSLPEQSVMIDILGKISSGCMFAMIANVIINAMMRSWVRFRDSLYKDEAYLTHTLPVTKNDLYNSKFIQTLIFFFVGFAVVLLSLFNCTIFSVRSCISIWGI